MMKLKISFILALLVTPFTGLLASDLSDYERHYEELNRLKGQLERLELQKQIQDIKTEIKRAQNERESLTIDPNAASSDPFTSGGISADFDPNNPDADASPSGPQLIYIIGTGDNTRAVIRFPDKRRTVKNGQTVSGWQVKIDGRKVELHKGEEIIEL